MRNISVALTKRQIIARTKTQTRRVGWNFTKPGELLQPVEKCQGLKKGEHVRKVGGPIRVIAVRVEQLDQISQEDVVAEGFPKMTPAEFVAMFCEANDWKGFRPVTVITFEYVDE